MNVTQLFICQTIEFKITNCIFICESLRVLKAQNLNNKINNFLNSKINLFQIISI